MRKMRILAVALFLVFALSLTGCGGDTSTSTPAKEAPSLVDVSTDKGINLKLPSDLVLQENGTYANMETGVNVALGTADIGNDPISDWTEEDVLALYQSKYESVVVKSFENGKKINGKEALQSMLNLKTPKGNDIILTLVMISDGPQGYIVNFIYGDKDAESALAQNLQTCIDSITIK